MDEDLVRQIAMHLDRCLRTYVDGDDTRATDLTGNELCDIARAIIPIVQVASGWQPIETAPKDGTRILLYAPAAPKATNENAQVPQIRVDRRVERYGWRYAKMLPEAPYTHWMPLPEPPTA